MPETQPLLQNQQRKGISRKRIIGLIIGIAVVAAVATTVAILESGGEKSVIANRCIWNVTNESYVNGLYSAASSPSKSGYPMYTLPIDPACHIPNDTLYLFDSMDSNSWSISWIPDNFTDRSLQGYCMSNDITDVLQCSGLWQIPPGRPQPDVMVLDAQCPAVSCKGIQVSYDEVLAPGNHANCIGVFGTRIANNLYQRGNSDLFLFFNPTLFRWACGSKSQMNGCVALHALTSYAVEQSWHNAHRLSLEGDSVSMLWSNGHRATLQCIQTASPTQSPTVSPTPSPTESPTPSPTVPPTIAPTAEPTDSPTAAPTESPTEKPTDSPTEKPTLRRHNVAPSQKYAWLLILYPVATCFVLH